MIEEGLVMLRTENVFSLRALTFLFLILSGALCFFSPNPAGAGLRAFFGTPIAAKHGIFLFWRAPKNRSAGVFC